MKSVSYTHLDVYKRQQLITLISAPLMTRLFSVNDIGIYTYIITIAVSYTHLDVYKRQM